MAHAHSHAPRDHSRAFAIGVGLNIAFVVTEAVFGLLSGSLALLADAGHNLSDVLGLLLAWSASGLARRKASPRHTYGLRKSTVLAAMFNAIILMIAVGGIAWEALRRIGEPGPVAATTVIAVAAAGVVVNAGTAMLFLRGHREDLNIRGAFLHMAADAGLSAGVVLAGVIIVFTGAAWVDPLTSLLIAAVILVSTWGLLRDSVNLAIDAVPEGVDAAAIEAYLQALPGVHTVHDLHVWGMSTTETALTAHLVRPGVADDDALLARVSRELRERFGIAHATLQVERSPTACPRHHGCGP